MSSPVEILTNFSPVKAHVWPYILVPEACHEDSVERTKAYHINYDSELSLLAERQRDLLLLNNYLWLFSVLEWYGSITNLRKWHYKIFVMALVQNAGIAVVFLDFIGAFHDCFSLCYICSLLALCQYFMTQVIFGWQGLMAKEQKVSPKIFSPLRILAFLKGGFHHVIIFSPKEDTFSLVTIENLWQVNEVHSESIIDYFL